MYGAAYREDAALGSFNRRKAGQSFAGSWRQKGRGDQFVDLLGVHPEKAQLAESIIKRQDAIMRETDQSSLCIYVGIPLASRAARTALFLPWSPKKGRENRM